jgi:lysozyme family protein
MKFPEAFQKLLGHEGAYSDNPKDRGNWTGGRVGVGTLLGTKYGIAANTYPNEDIKNLTVERARELYFRDYWGPAGCDAVPDGVKYDLFDMAVNSGVSRAVRTLQAAVGETDDGVLGPRTLQAIQSMHPARVVARFNGSRLKFMASLSDWPAFSRGWANRIASNLLNA